MPLSTPAGIAISRRTLPATKPGSAAFLAGASHDRAGTAAGRTGRLHAENSGGLHDLPVPAAPPARFARGAGRGSGAFALRTGPTPLELHRLGHAAGRLFQVQRHLAADVVPAMGAATGGCRPRRKNPRTCLRRHIPERFEDVFDVVELRGAALQARVPVPIVAGPLVRIGQHFVGLGRLLELPRGVFVAGIAVRVELDGLLAIRRCNLLRRRGAGDPENFVIVRFFSHHACHGPSATVKSIQQSRKPGCGGTRPRYLEPHPGPSPCASRPLRGEVACQ